MKKNTPFKIGVAGYLSLYLALGPAAAATGSAAAPVRRTATDAAATMSRPAASNSSAVVRFLKVSQPQTETLSPGQSGTLLPDGSWLLLGGRGADGSASAAAYLKDARTGNARPLARGLLRPRAGHTATLLPDGTVLVLGGVGGDGKVVDGGELFDAAAMRSEPLAADALTARADHTATLLTEGQVLVAGGVSRDGQPVRSVALWEPKTRTSTAATAELSGSRLKHSATLQPDGSVLLWGGTKEDGTGLDDGELYEPETGRLSWIGAFAKYEDENAPYLRASLPKDGATDVPVDGRVALRFSKALRVNTVSPSTISLKGPQGAVEAVVTPAEGGMLVFITPKQPLLAATTYTVTLADAVDESERALSYMMLSFTTAGGDDAGDAGESWLPDARNMRGDWRSNRPESRWQHLPPLEAGPGVTAVAGQVLLLNGNPLPDATLQIGSRTALTDRTGRFLLTDVPTGHQVLRLDGRGASKPRKTYGFFKIGVEVEAGRTNVLPFTSWMPRLDTEHVTPLPVPTSAEVAVTTPYIPGLEVRIPQSAVVRDVDGAAVTQLSITPIPIDRTPFPLPRGVIVPVFFTVQPGAARVIPPRARVVYPNYAGDRPGTRMNFWNYDPEGKGWYVYGQGTVTPDGRQVVPDAGVVLYEFNGFMLNRNGEPPPPGSGPNPGSDAGDGDPVDLATGLFVYEKTDLVVQDLMPITLTRTYRPEDAALRPFGIGTSHPYELYLYSAQEYVEADLILPTGGRVHFVRISPGSGFSDAEFEHTSSASVFYKSRLKWNGNGWDLTLKNGMKYVFGDEAPLNTIIDRYGNKITVARANTNGFGSPTGNITRLTSSNGRWVEFTYDASNRITQAKDNIARTVSYTYDASGRLWKVTDPNGGVTEYTYDTANRMLTIKDARLNTYLTNEYDANGRVVKQTQADNTTFRFAYTLSAGRVVQTDVTNPRDIVRRITFSTSGHTLTDTYALGRPEQQTITYERQANTNLLLSQTDGRGRKTAYAYDASGNVTGVTRLAGTPDAVTTAMTYEPTRNQVATITDPLNHQTRFDYDGQGNLLSITDPLNHQTTLTYNASGQPLTVTNPLGHTTHFEYAGGDLVGVTDPLGRTIKSFIDGAGRLLRVTNPLGQSIKYEFDGLNRLTRLVDPLGGVTAYSYDPNGNLLSVTDARNGVTSYVYDSMDRMTTRKDALLHTETYEYDAAGNLSKFTDRRGKVTAYGYDGLNRQIFVGFGATDNGGTTTYESTVGNTYDNGNRLTRIVDSAAGTIDLGFDELDHLTSQTSPQGSVGYTYNATGRRASMTVAGQPSVAYSYDDANRLTGVTQGASAVAIGYDNANRRTALTLPNGVVAEYAYDQGAQLTGVTFRKDAAVLGDLTYKYDLGGRRVRAGGSFSRVNLPQPFGSATYNAANQLTQLGQTALSYDANGNLTGDGSSTFNWDARNHLAAVAGPSPASFQYDALGRRVAKTVNGVTTEFLFDSLNVVQERIGGNPSANLLTGAGLDEIFTRSSGAGTHTLITDGIGSTLALLDAAGSVQAQYTYEPFGKTTCSDPGAGNAAQFIGRDSDETGLYHFRSRYYSPSLQRFLSEDPIEFKGGDLNLYAYVGNNPVNLRDPLGHQAESVSALPENSSWFRMLWEFTSGTGPDHRSFGPESDMTQGLRTSPDVDWHRGNWCSQGKPRYQDQVHGQYGVDARDGPWESGRNMPRQFVGSFSMTIVPGPNGKALFIARNTTSLPSLLYHIPGVPALTYGGPFSNKTQSYWWTEDCPCTTVAGLSAKKVGCH